MRVCTIDRIGLHDAIDQKKTAVHGSFMLHEKAVDGENADCA